MRYIGVLEVCHLLPDHVEARQTGWLPSCFNPGQALAIEVYARTKVEISMHQARVLLFHKKGVFRIGVSAPPRRR